MKKSDVLKLIEEKPNLSKSDLKSAVNSISLKGEYNLSKIKIGDVFVHRYFNHPAIIIKKIAKKDQYICVSLTTTHNKTIILTELNQRIHNTVNYVTTTVTTCNAENICTNYMFTVEQKEIKRIKQLLREYFYKNL